VLTTHNLPEADELCDLIGMFRGQLLRLDTPTALRASIAGRGTLVRVVGPPTVWSGAVAGLGFVRGVELQGDGLAVYLDDPELHNPILIQTLIAAGARVRYVEPLERSLEDVYLELVAPRFEERRMHSGGGPMR
jgi:ABC-2 type transport system ATP-binding protein